MPSVIFHRLPLSAVVLLMPLLLAGGCGDVTSQATFNSPTGTHVIGWGTAHKADARADITRCTGCHGSNLSGGISGVSCMSRSAVNGLQCHATSPALAPTGCTSCHGAPPNGQTAPNRATAHAKHLAMAGVTCSTCHNGAGSGTVNHARGTATVSPLPVAYRAKTFTAFGYTAATGSCSGIACHGGVATPSWNTGSINVATGCLTCHEQGTAPQTPQYNSFYSGAKSFGGPSAANLHALHLALPDLTAPGGAKVFCTACHNATVQTKEHFPRLYNPAAAPVVASATIGGPGTKVSVYTPYTAAVPSGSCTTSCHGTRYWMN